MKHLSGFNRSDKQGQLVVLAVNESSEAEGQLQLICF